MAGLTDDELERLTAVGAIVAFEEQLADAMGSATRGLLRWVWRQLPIPGPTRASLAAASPPPDSLLLGIHDHWRRLIVDDVEPVLIRALESGWASAGLELEDFELARVREYVRTTTSGIVTGHEVSGVSIAEHVVDKYRLAIDDSVRFDWSQRRLTAELRYKLGFGFRPLEDGRLVTLEDWRRREALDEELGELMRERMPFLFDKDGKRLRSATDEEVEAAGLGRLFEEREEVAARIARAEQLEADEILETGRDLERRRYPSDLEYRAERIGRTEAGQAVNYGRFIGAGERGMTSKRWQATRDGRTRPMHRHASGQCRPIAEPFELGDGSRLMHPGDRSLGASGAATIQCVTAGTLVAPVGELLRVYRGRHEGALLRVEASDGSQLTVTPNHQVLTPGGWVAAQSLDVGDQLVDADLLERRGGRAPQVRDVPALAGEVYRSACESGHAQRIAGGRVDFHGDRPVGEVDVVTLAGAHLLPIDPALGQHAAHEDLVGLGSEPRSLGGRCCACDLDAANGLGLEDDERATATRGVGCGCSGASLLGRGPAGAGDARLAGRPSLDALPLECAGDCRPADAERCSERELALAGEVPRGELALLVGREGAPPLRGSLASPLDARVVEGSDDRHGAGGVTLGELLDRGPVEVLLGDGGRELHVTGLHWLPPGSVDIYTLETSSGTYRTGAVLSRNCRCVASYSRQPCDGEGGGSLLEELEAGAEGDG